MPDRGSPSQAGAAGSLLTMPPLALGTVLRPLNPEDDLLEEMLGDA